jgi:hypothetical protein
MPDPTDPKPTQKPKRKQSASSTYAARLARGKPLISLTIDVSVLEQMDELAQEWGVSRAEAVTRAVRVAHEAQFPPKKGPA